VTPPKDQNPVPKRNPLPAAPVAHLLALAPLDVWFRILLGTPIHPRYWIRLFGIGFTSLVGTLWSLPERIIFAICWKLFKKNPEQLDHPPGVLVIVGYYRSGTTHAHNLIACDPGVVTPRWYQALLGQGCWLSWAVTRFLLVPFLGASRPQDGVGFGPMWPAEDDFALAGWGACSTLPGRLILPSRWSKWSKWNTLETCTDAERARWRRTLAGFAWKVTRRHPQKMLVLKTPSHGAHITELVEIFGDHVRFLHVSRDPNKVIESNMRMHDDLASHLLEQPLDPSTLRDRIVTEYRDIEHATIAQSQSLDEGRLAFITHEALIADPIGQLATAYQTLGLEHSAAHQNAITQYLHDLGAYQRPLHTPIDLGDPTASEPESIQQLRALHPSKPTPERVNLPPAPYPARTFRPLLGLSSAIIAAIAWGLLWIGIIWVIKQINPDIKPRLDQLVWIGGSAVGLAAVHFAGAGSKRLGYIAAGLTLLVFVSISFPITVINWNFAAESTTSDFLYHNSKGALHGILAPSSIAFAVLGMLTAWRHASSTGPRAPGT
tara:strand:- start:117519 stop:119162 length:1644 start_codon:yes stop_codon:yes gene_type:complete